MTNINLDLAVKLDGSETHMIAILVDSWGDKLVVPLNCEMVIEPADYFIPCAHCGNAVLECNFDAGMDTCDRCNAGHKSSFVPATKGAITEIVEVKNLVEVKMELRKGMHVVKSNTSVVVNQDLDKEERLTIALEAAEFAFWDVIARSYPEAVSGDYLMEDISVTCRPNVEHWLENNVPTAWRDGEKTPEDWTEDMGLHYPGVWHLHHTGGGCMVVTSDNVVVAMEHRYMGITSECVIIYTDTFTEDSFLNVWDEANVWSFGDNPTVLMNIIDEAFGGNCLWNTGHLFDDIMSIAKSGKC